MDENAIDNMPDVSLVDNDIAPKAAEPSQPETTPAVEGTGAEEISSQPEEPSQPSEGEKQPEVQPQEAPQDTDADRRRHNAEMAARRVQERQAVKNAVTRQIDDNYAPTSQEEFEAQGLKPVEAQLQAMQSRMVYNEERARLAELNASLQADAVTVMSDMPVFNPQSKEYDPEFTQIVEQQYKQAARLQADQNGLVLQADVPLYDFYNQMYAIYQRGSTKGSAQAQTETLQTMSRTEEPGGSSATTNAGSLDDLEARLGDMVIT